MKNQDIKELEQIRLNLETEAEKRNQDRDNMIKLYKAIQSISTQVPGFHNSEIDKTSNTIKNGLDIMLSWLAKEGQTHFPSNK